MSKILAPRAFSTFNKQILLKRKLKILLQHFQTHKRIKSSDHYCFSHRTLTDAPLASRTFFRPHVNLTMRLSLQSLCTDGIVYKIFAIKYILFQNERKEYVNYADGMNMKRPLTEIELQEIAENLLYYYDGSDNSHEPFDGNDDSYEPFDEDSETNDQSETDNESYNEESE
ncbi:hypothetical protein FQA39_LY09311 [Lamprigera yunnana]|nr:hypothetical protein FQA39_LY09311 [Lamprigera yunnana]